MDMWPKLTNLKLRLMCRKGACLMSSNSGLRAICTTNKHSDEAWFLWKWRYPNYYHNGPVYATMISILGTLGRLNEMRDVIEQMKEDSCECKDSVFVSVIKTYANVGLVDEADKVIGLDGIRMLDQNTSRTLRIYPLENITKCDGKFDGKTVIITIPMIPGKVPKKETQPTEKEPSQEAE
ncbi:hypothetical protein JHK84_031883 [Glycine max]|nr:hypothetical protein JHK84_031883 [Glycine max]